MLEALAINLVAGGLHSVGSVGLDKARDILRRSRFSKKIDDLTTEFTDALKESISEAVGDDDYAEIQDIRANWTTIAEELEELDNVFENEQEAIIRITEAVATGLEVNLDRNPQLQELLEAAVASAYQTALQGFADRIAGTDLADVFNTEANIELTASVNNLEEQVGAIQRQLRSQRAAALQNAGITWLDLLYFERAEPNDPVSAWQNGFNFADIAAGYPLLRERPTQHDNGERTQLTAEITDRLDRGENLVVLGDGGSGKSTVCKQVAHQWHTDDKGPVFYRSSKARTAFDEPGPLIQAIRDTDDEVLVVVEDAATKETAPAYDVLDRFGDAEDVSFLFDSRQTAWRNTDELVGAPSLKQHRDSLGIVPMPAFDPAECQRAVDHYEQLTDETVGRSGERLHEEIRMAGIGEGLILAYELVKPGTGAQGNSALHDDVHGAYDAVSEFADGDDFSQIVAMLVNVLNAAQLPVEKALIHAVATDRDEHRSVERMQGLLEGTMLNSTASGLEAPHPVWSVLYLEQVLNKRGEHTARDYFERCVEALFQLFDDEQRREGVIRWLRKEPEIVENISDSPEKEAGQFVRRLADIGEDRATLGVLYGTPRTWRVPLPDACPAPAKANWHNNRGTTHFARGALDDAEAEYERVEELAQEIAVDTPSEQTKWQKIALGNLGAVATKRGELDQAENYHQQSLELKREVDDRHGQANSLNNLGLVAESRGELDQAENYHQQSLELHREAGDRNGQANSLNNLGAVAESRGELDQAEEYFQQSLELDREVGDRHSQAQSLGNLGLVAESRGELDQAENYHRQSLELHREVGDRHGQAISLHSLGVVARKRGELDQAEENIEQAAEIYLDVGAMSGAFSAIECIISICEEQQRTEAAREWCNQAIAVSKQVSNDEAREKFQDRLDGFSK